MYNIGDMIIGNASNTYGLTKCGVLCTVVPKPPHETIEWDDIWVQIVDSFDTMAYPVESRYFNLVSHAKKISEEAWNMLF